MAYRQIKLLLLKIEYRNLKTVCETDLRAMFNKLKDYFAIVDNGLNKGS